MKNSNFSKLYLIFAGLICFCYACDFSNQKSKNANVPKYVFYFIGDGMGHQHVKLTEAYLHACNQDAFGFDKLAFDTLPVSGTSTTHAANRLITGSAAAGTALATGFKTNIDRLAMSPYGEESFQSIATVFKNKGKKVGIISSVSIDHATPAVFYAHCKDRDVYFTIGKQLAESDFDFFGGGGLLEPENDDVNLYDYLEENDYQVIREQNGINQTKPDEKTVLINPVLGDEAEMPYAIDRKYVGGYSLADFTRIAIENLYGDTGFFIMVEGGKIDWAAHANDAATIVREVIDFDKAVQEALKFYLQHPDETLVVVTSDHETGGLGLGNAEMKFQTNYALLEKQSMSVEYMAELLHSGYINASDLPEIFDLDDLSRTESEQVKEAAVFAGNEVSHIRYGGYSPLPVTYGQILNKRAGVGFTTWEHTAAPVPVYAIGPGAEIFSGQMDNTDIPKRIMQVTGYDFTEN
ncbi:MAG: alkaline phosphatase [Candidatus Delongbacteria bacterium]|jgi:alkaline phosphatase|nr:alkaline phosphatase [Candidatus Delongbacteria bacterium]